MRLLRNILRESNRPGFCLPFWVERRLLRAAVLCVALGLTTLPPSGTPTLLVGVRHHRPIPVSILDDPACLIEVVAQAHLLPPVSSRRSRAYGPGYRTLPERTTSPSSRSPWSRLKSGEIVEQAHLGECLEEVGGTRRMGRGGEENVMF